MGKLGTELNFIFFKNVHMYVEYILPTVKGPGFSSNPDITNNFCVTLAKTNRYDNIIKDSNTVFVFSLFSKVTLLVLNVDFFPAKVPILDLY